MSWQYDQRFPTFEVDGIKFALTFQDDEFGTSAVLLFWTGSSWNSWGGTPDVTGIMVDPITEEKIMEHGSLRNFMVWLSAEALKRAKIKAQMPIPAADDRIGRFRYHLISSVDWDGTKLVVKPAPLTP